MSTRHEQKVQTRLRILEAAGRSFRKNGYGGIGVDGLAKEAGVTSGAFYGHFDSKGGVFREAVVAGMADLNAGVVHFQTTHDARWWPEFVHFYLGAKRRCDLSESCSLQSLSPEVGRAPVEVREAFELGLREVARTLLAGVPSAGMPRDEAQALSALSALMGAVTMARAVSSPELADTIAQSTERLLLSQFG